MDILAPRACSKYKTDVTIEEFRGATKRVVSNRKGIKEACENAEKYKFNEYPTLCKIMLQKR